MKQLKKHHRKQTKGVLRKEIGEAKQPVNSYTY